MLSIIFLKLLDDNGVKRIDFMLIDIEELELEVLEGFDIEWFWFVLVCIEWLYKNKEEILVYFDFYYYEMFEEYEFLDNFNWYFVFKINLFWRYEVEYLFVLYWWYWDILGFCYFVGCILLCK